MTISEFVTKYIGKKVDYDNAYGAQCVDLFRQCSKEVYGTPHTGIVTGAKDVFLNYEKLPIEKQYYERVFESSHSTPYAGDFVIWGETNTNKFGHIAIVLGVTQDGKLLVFEQDGFKQDGAKLSIKSTNNVLGYLRYRK